MNDDYLCCTQADPDEQEVDLMVGTITITITYGGDQMHFVERVYDHAGTTFGTYDDVLDSMTRRIRRLLQYRGEPLS